MFVNNHDSLLVMLLTFLTCQIPVRMNTPWKNLETMDDSRWARNTNIVIQEARAGTESQSMALRRPNRLDSAPITMALKVWPSRGRLPATNNGERLNSVFYCFVECPLLPRRDFSATVNSPSCCNWNVWIDVNPREKPVFTLPRRPKRNIKHCVGKEYFNSEWDSLFLTGKS